MMFVPSPPAWNMVKDAPNYVLINMISLDQTSHGILKDGDIPIFLVVPSNQNSLQLKCDCTVIPLSTFCVDVNTIYI